MALLTRRRSIQRAAISASLFANFLLMKSARLLARTLGPRGIVARIKPATDTYL
ncbi:hypothetical protein [Sphingobium phenoxybenzoativorans]|uniref:hypothetical protein n=1 Tax=Sphingobium phenoxybenzoativorans TaxID=1592790 RepID=UPI001495E928|nr:hypothetical protein [Sphingobium phenoxybenzoativorans]